MEWNFIVTPSFQAWVTEKVVEWVLFIGDTGEGQLGGKMMS